MGRQAPATSLLRAGRSRSRGRSGGLHGALHVVVVPVVMVMVVMPVVVTPLVVAPMAVVPSHRRGLTRWVGDGLHGHLGDRRAPHER